MYDNSKRDEWLERINRVINDGRFKDTWASLSQYEHPRWFRDAKLGIFIHWGLYSIPAFGSEWYSRNMYKQGSVSYEHHIATYGKHTEFGYKDFIPMFTAADFNAHEWMELIKHSGARYVVPVAEHHDGYQMYKTNLSKWNSVDMNPHRDIIGELFAAANSQGLIACASTHRLEHWFFMGCGRSFESDVKYSNSREDLYWPSCEEQPSFTDACGNVYPADEYLDDWLIRTCEFIDSYKPAMLYFDWMIMLDRVKPWLRKIAAYYYNRANEWGSEVVISYKYDAFPLGAAVPDMERGQYAEAMPYVWQSCTSVAKNSWGYTVCNEYKSLNQLICSLSDIVSKNGCMLLNIDPMASGAIPQATRKLLIGLGEWLSINGEAIYGASPWRVAGEGELCRASGQFADGEQLEYACSDIRYTANNGCIYAIMLGTASDGTYRLKQFAKTENIDADSCFKGTVAAVSALDGTPISSVTRNDKHMTVATKRRERSTPLVLKIETI